MFEQNESRERRRMLNLGGLDFGRAEKRWEGRMSLSLASERERAVAGCVPVLPSCGWKRSPIGVAGSERKEKFGSLFVCGV
jgi:hypothetical protein